MILEEALALLGDEFRFMQLRENGSMTHAPNGEMYEVARAATVAEWLGTMRARGKGKNTIYWRIEPEQNRRYSQVQIYSRQAFGLS